MTFRIFTGSDLEHRVARVGCCQRCAFQEERLVAWEYEGRESVHCHECLAHETCFMHDEGRIVYLPEMPVEAFSNYFRVLSWASFAARCDTLGGHDFSDGTLPPAFADGHTWDARLRWASLEEALLDEGADPVARADITKVVEASAFLLERTEYTSRHYASENASTIRAKVGSESFQRDFRVMHDGIPVSRIRSWGKPGSTFSMIAHRERARKRG